MKQLSLLLLLVFNFSSVFGLNKCLAPSATISGGTTVCQNATGVVVTFTGSGGTAPYTFTYTATGASGNQTISTTGTNSSVNLTIPTGIAGTFTYNLVSVHDAIIPITSIPQSGSQIFTIKSQPDATLNGTGSGSTFGGIPVFKICINANQTFTFTNGSTTASTLDTNYKIVWGDGSPDYNANTWTTPLTHSYSVGLWNLVYTIQSSNGCPITKNYIVFVGSNPAVSLGNPGNTDICNSSPLTFPITGTTNNPPGTTYTVTFNDGSSAQVFNHPPPASVTHTFNISSCGVSSSNGTTTFQNSFSANIVAENPCGASAVGVVPIYVSTPPVANFSLPTTGCTNTSVCITNSSTGAYENNGSSSSCNTSPKFIWSISPSTGFTISSGTLGNDFGNTDPSLWTSGTSPLCLNFTQAGTYTITIKTGNRCGFDTKVKTICIEPPILPSFTINTNSGCIPLSITTNNTTTPVNQCSAPTYAWSITYASGYCGNTSVFTYTGGTSSSSTSPSFSFTEAGTYTIKLTASNSCSPAQTATQVITVKKPPTVSLSNIANLCQSAVLIPVSSIASCTNTTPTYLWSFPGGTPSSATTAIPPSVSYTSVGNYTISLAVTNECGTTTATSNSFTVLSAPIVQNEITTVCSGVPFSVTPLSTTVGNVIPSGTTYSWSAPSVTGGITGGVAGINQTLISGTLTNPTILPQTATYTVTPKSGTCAGATFTVVVTVNPSPTIITQPSSSSVCLGGTPIPLTVTLNSSSGTPNYQWYSNTTISTTGGTLINTATSATFNPPSSTVGTLYYYCVISLASGGCSGLTSAIPSVTVNPLPTITTQPIASQNICVGVTIPTPLSVTYTGGTSSPTYQWYFNNNTNSNLGGTLISGATASSYTPPVFTTAGSFYYYVEVNNCGILKSNVAEIVLFNDPTISSQPMATQTLCQTAIPTNLVVVPNGAGTFTYQWYSNSSNNITSGILISGATNNTYTPPTTLSGTKYYYCVISQNGILGCGVTSATAAVIVTIAPTLTAQPVSSTVCLGQSPTQLSVASNSTLTTNYQWYSNTSSSTTGATSIGSANSPNYMPPATTIGTVYYYCEITFPSLSGGCSVITSNIAFVTINPKPIITSQNITICSGATLAAPISNSTDVIPAGTTYTWSAPTINPIGSITGATAQVLPQTSISQILINTTTAPATVTYTVSTTTGSCVGSTFTVTVTVNPATNPNVTKTDITCFGVNNGSITTNITGGIPPYVTTWTYPNGTNSSATSISNLVSGVYNLSITDAGGCPISNNYTINEPPDIVITTDTNNNISCFGSNNGAIAITVTGGTGAYSYSWIQNTLAYATTDDISNLAPATYVVSVSDANNCGPKTTTFTITEPPILAVNLVSQTNVDCYGFATGSITVNVAGGTPNPSTLDYSYSWIGPNGFTSSNQNITNLLAGIYNLTVTDNLLCSKNLLVTITESPEIIINAITTPIVCDGDNNGTIAVTLSGGNPPYLYQWDNLAVGLNQNNLAPGNYTITVTDAKLCVKSLIINIPSPPIFRVNPIVTNISCFGAHDGSIVLNFVGGIAPVNLIWSDGSTAGITRNNLGPGSYSVIITDAKPCTISKTFTIIEPQPLVLAANLTNALDCNNANTGAINLLVSGGTPPFVYTWNNGAITEDLTNIPAGNYAITVTDARGCTKTAQYSITRPNPLALSVNTTTNANCNAHTVTQIFTAQPTGGVPLYQFNWSSGTVTGTNNEFMTTTQNGLVTVTATDAIGCTTNYSLNVVLPTLGNPTFSPSSIGYTSYGIYSILDPIQFNSTITGDYTSVLWDFGDGTFSNELNPVHTYLIPNDYYLVTQTVTYPFGCVYVMHLALKVEVGYLLVVPSAFTPNNNDGINDTLRPVTKGLKNVHLDIYDTWGSLIYSEVGDVIVGWNGKIKGINSENGNYYAKVSGETFYGTIVNENHTFVLIK